MCIYTILNVDRSNKAGLKFVIQTEKPAITWYIDRDSYNTIGRKNVTFG